MQALVSIPDLLKDLFHEQVDEVLTTAAMKGNQPMASWLLEQSGLPISS